MLEILTPPATNLVSLESAKAHLQVTSTDDDAVLTSLIARASAAIVSYLSFNPNTAGYRETTETGIGQSYVLLSRMPVSSITIVTVDGVTLSAGGYRLDSASGLLARTSDSRSRAWEGRAVVTIEYTAGYTDTPADLQQAALTLISSEWAARGKDPGLKGIGIGSISLTYFTPDALPSIASVAPLLSPYRAVGIG
jgi:uncharacterized phiE125 gp8 family phage protein